MQKREVCDMQLTRLASAVQDMVAKGYAGIPHGEALGFYKAMLFEHALHHPTDFRRSCKRGSSIREDAGEADLHAHGPHQDGSRKRARQHQVAHPDSNDDQVSDDSMDLDNDEGDDSEDDSGDNNDNNAGGGVREAHDMETQPQGTDRGDIHGDVVEADGRNNSPAAVEIITEVAAAEQHAGAAGDDEKLDEGHVRSKEERPRVQQPSQMNHKWGQYSFSMKKTPRQDGKHSFAWECRCPYHMKNWKTGCKKTATVPYQPGEDRWEEVAHATLLSLRQWAIQAQQTKMAHAC